MDDLYSYRLSELAKNQFITTHNQLYNIVHNYSDKCQKILEPYLKRWSPFILKLAMLMKLFEDPFSKELSDTSINSAMAIILPAIKSTAQLFEGELGDSDHQRKCRLDWIHNRISKNKQPTWAALITSEILDGGSTMYEYPMKTLIEGGLVKEITKKHKKENLYMPIDE